MLKRRYGLAAGLFATVGIFGAGAHPVRAAAEIVVATRYLLPTGTSHAHLFLYREDGKFLRQLTKDDSGQDREPIFAPDGETIVFTRQKGNSQEFWSIRPLGGDLHKLPAAPGWYTATRSSPFFTNTNPDPKNPIPQNNPDAGDKAPIFPSPDRSLEVLLRVDPKDDDDGIDGPGHGKHYVLRDTNTKQETEFGKLPGFEGAYDLLHRNDGLNQSFLEDGPLRLAFFGLHLDSTAGDTVYALDLSPPRRFVRLSPNWAAPFPLPGDVAFLTLTEVRYVPIPGSTKTANSTYVERWDAHLKKIRFAHAGAAVCYGASMYRPAKTPAVITIRDMASSD